MPLFLPGAITSGIAAQNTLAGSEVASLIARSTGSRRARSKSPEIKIEQVLPINYLLTHAAFQEHPVRFGGLCLAADGRALPAGICSRL